MTLLLLSQSNLKLTLALTGFRLARFGGSKAVPWSAIQSEYSEDEAGDDDPILSTSSSDESILLARGRLLLITIGPSSSSLPELWLPRSKLSGFYDKKTTKC